MTSTMLSPVSEPSHERVRCKVDEPFGPGPFTFAVGQEVVVTGWAFLDPVSTSLPAISLEAISHRTGAITRVGAERCARPDVAAHFGTEQLLMSGFTSRFRIDSRSIGEVLGARLSERRPPHVRLH